MASRIADWSASWLLVRYAAPHCSSLSGNRLFVRGRRLGEKLSFFTHDSTDARTMAGCSSMASGYAGAVIGIGHQAAVSNCVTSFGVGSSYYGGTSGN